MMALRVRDSHFRCWSNFEHQRTRNRRQSFKAPAAKRDQLPASKGLTELGRRRYARWSFNY